MKDRMVARKNILLLIIFALLCTTHQFTAVLLKEAGKAYFVLKKEVSPTNGVSLEVAQNVELQNVDYCNCLENIVSSHATSAAYCERSSPEYIFFAFYVDGNFVKLTSGKFSGSSEDSRSKSGINERGNIAAKMISQLWESIARVHIKSCLALRTNNKHLFTRKRGILVIDSELTAFPSYTSTKVAAQIEFYNLLQRNLIAKEFLLIFLDPDMLLVGSVDELLQTAKSYDVAVTVRNYVKMPINAGFVVVSGYSNPDLINLAFKEMIDIGKNLSTVFADQIALKSVFPCSNYKKPSSYVTGYNLRILCTLASRYNASPRDVHTKISKDTKVLHFKGDRKMFQDKTFRILKSKSARSAIEYNMNI